MNQTQLALYCAGLTLYPCLITVKYLHFSTRHHRRAIFNMPDNFNV
jgi:hypothetical protein